MRKFLGYSAYIAVFLIYIITSAQKNPDKGKYYYAFNEKIYIEQIPDKFLVKAKDRQTATELISFAKTSLQNHSKVKYQDEKSFTVDLKEAGKTVNDLFKNKMSDIVLIKPAYKYQKQEMYYADEILAEPNNGISIEEVVSKTGLSSVVAIRKNNFYAVLEVQSSNDACDVANIIQESGLVTTNRESKS
jgi:hypothetical protein